MVSKYVRLSILKLKRAFCLMAGLAIFPGLAAATTTINHQFSPATINQGDVVPYTITIANDSLIALTAADVTVVLPADIGIASPLVSVNGCNFSSVSSVPGSSSVVLTGGTIPAKVAGIDGQCSFQVNVTSIVPGSHVATIPANATPTASTSGYTALENTVSVFNTTLANATLVVTALSPPTGSKLFSPSPGISGVPITLTITLTNPNAGSTMPLTSFSDTLPAGMEVASPANASISCNGTGAVSGSVSATPGAGSISLTGGTIGQSGICTISTRVLVPAVTGTSQTFANTLAAGAIGNTRGLTSAGFSRSVIVNSPISVAKSFNATTVSAGLPSLMTIIIGNNSTVNPLVINNFNDNLTGTTITLLGTASSPVAAIANPAVSCSGTGALNGTLLAPVDMPDATINLTSATAGPGGNCTITAYATTTTDGLHTNSIATNAVQNPDNHGSPAASANLTANAQLTVGKTVALNQVAPGQWTTFTVTINNWSGSPVTNVSFTDTLPSASGNQMVLDGANPTSSVGCSGGTWGGSDGASALTWTGGTVAAGSGSTAGVCTIVFRARLPGTATTNLIFTNQIPANSITGNGDGPGASTTVTNPNASPAVNVTTVDLVAVGKSFSPTSIAQGGTSTLTLRVRNRTTSTLTAVALTDTLPAGLTLAANPAATNTCGGSLQAFPGDDQVILIGGTVNARPTSSLQTECVITVRVTGTTLGPYTNTIRPADFSSSAGTIPANVSANLTITTSLSGSKSFSPTSVTSGGSARVTLRAINSSNAELTGLAINDSNFSAGLSVANPANATTSCAGSPTLVANPGATSAQLFGATLSAGSGCDFAFDVKTSGTGPWSNAVPVGGISSAEGPFNSAAVSANLAAATASISINKSFNPVIVTGGVPSLLTIDVINSSSIAINQVGFTDTFPNGIEIYSVSNASTNCAGGTVSAVPGDGRVSLAGATLAPNSVCQVYVTTTSVKFLNLTNTIPAGAIFSAQGYTNALGTTASLSTLQGLGVMKNFVPAFIGPGQSARLKIRLVSSFDPNVVSPVTLTGVSFTDVLPVGLVFAASPNASTTCTGSSLTVNTSTQALTISDGNLTPGNTCDIEVDVTAPLGSYNNIIPAFQIVTDQGVTNQNPASATLAVVNVPTIAKAFNPSAVRVGQNSTLTVTITNNASVPLTGVSLTDTLPVGVAVYATPAASTTCSGGVVSALAGDNEISLSGATIPASGSCTFRADVVGNLTGPLINTIGASAITSNQGLTNPGSASATLTILSPPGISKAFNPVSIASGEVSKLIITLENINATPITLSAALVDALPGNVFVAPTPNVVKNCTGAVTAAAGATSITYANGASIPAGGCTIEVDVTSAVSGGHTNIIAAGQLQTSAGNNPNPAVATLGVNQPTPPTVDKDFSPSTINLGASSTLTITLGNPNTTVLTLASDFVDTLPANLVLGTPATSSGTCTGLVTAVDGGSSVTYASGATIPAGGCSIILPVSSATAGSYINMIAAGDLVSVEAGTNGQPVTAGLVVRAPTPPSVTKSFGFGTINPGGITRLTITLENANASSISLTAAFVDTLPANVLIAATPNVGGTCTAVAVTATGGGSSVTYASGATIPAGGCTIQVDITSALPGGPYVNTVAAGALQTTAGVNGAPATAGLFVNPAQPPSVSKSFSPTTVFAGGVSTLTITLGNGNASATALTANLVDTLPTNVVVANPPSIQVTTGCTLANVVAFAGAGTVTYQSGGSIPAGGCTIAVNVTSALAGTYTNSIAAGQLQTGFGTNLVETNAPLQVNLASPTTQPPSVSKSFSPATVFAGGVSTLTITLGNSNASAVTLTADLVDNLPAGVTVNLATAASGSCTHAQVSMTATAVTYASGASIPAGGCTIIVAVTSSAIGSHLNTIPAGNLQTNAGNSASAATAPLTVNIVSVPTLSQWGMLLLAGLMVLVAFQSSRRPRSTT